MRLHILRTHSIVSYSTTICAMKFGAKLRDGLLSITGAKQSKMFAWYNLHETHVVGNTSISTKSSLQLAHYNLQIFLDTLVDTLAMMEIEENVHHTRTTKLQ